jgi:ATP-dependent Zn protease
MSILLYAEAGHAIVGALMPEYDPVAKISIIPRGGAGGLTFFTPSEERLESGLYSRSYLENQMAVALGGRIAEEIIYGPDNVTTGASNDFQQVGGSEMGSRMRSKRTIRFLEYCLSAAGFFFVFWWQMARGCA